MECQLCFEEYTAAGDTCPYSMPCGHTYCKGCLARINPLKCPKRCKPPGGLKLSSLSKNFGLIEHMETVEERDKERGAHVDPMGMGLGGEMEVEMYRLPYSGVVRVHPAACSTATMELPLPVVVLDRSPSMGGALRWIINVAVPSALAHIGYPPTQRVRLITFDSVTEVVRLRGGDPMLRDLREIPVSGRGTRTLMAGAVEELGNLLSMGGAYNVVVVSDGFVDDMEATHRAAATAARLTPSDARIAFTMIRFFNGHPPDTVALSMCGAFGTVGPAPVVDCNPPAQWECSICTFLNPTIARRCEMCDTPTSSTMEAKDEGPLGTFLRVFTEAFSTQMLPHIKVHGSVSRMPRAPITAPSCIEVPIGIDTFLQLDGDSLIVGNRVCKFVERAVEGEAGLGLEGRLEGELEPYFNAVLAQVRLWVLAGTRSEAMHEIIDLCKRVRDTRSDQAAGGNGLKHRAWAIRKSTEKTESTLSRITALGSAEDFVKELGSKQQGDFLRASSVATSDRLLARRALGPDIVYHDSCKACLADASIEGATDTGVQSAYGGSTYTDVLRAAKCLATVAKDLTAADVLKVVGGLGVPFTATVSNKDDAWSMCVQGLDATLRFAESDIWAAKDRRQEVQLGTGTTAAGVIPLGACGPTAHYEYMTSLRPVAVMHLGAQLNGALPVKPWGWANVFSNPAGGPPDFSHALCDGFLARATAGLAYAAETFYCDGHHTTAAEGEVTAQLLSEVARHGQNELPNSSAVFLKFLRTVANSDSAAAVGVLQEGMSHQTVLQLIAAMFTAASRGVRPQNSFLMRAIYETTVQLGLKEQRTLSSTQRRELILRLCCRDYGEKRTPVTKDALDRAVARYKRSLEGEEEGEEAVVVCCDEVQSPAEVAAEVKALGWAGHSLPVGVYRVLSGEEAELSQVFISEKDTPEVAYVMAAIVVNALEEGKPLCGALDTPKFALRYLKKKVSACFQAEYRERLQLQVTTKYFESVRDVVEMQRSYRAGTEQPGMIDTFQDPRTLVVLRLGRAPWAPSTAYTTTRCPRSF